MTTKTPAEVLAEIRAEVEADAYYFEPPNERLLALDAAIAALSAPQGGGEVEPFGWVYQHEETGHMSFCPNDGVNTPEFFQRLNSRHVLCGPVYTAPPAQQPRLSAEIINALPEEVRSYIMWLETDADPAGTLGDNWHLTRENAAVRKLMEQAALAMEQVGEDIAEIRRNYDGAKRWLFALAMEQGGSVTVSRQTLYRMRPDDKLTIMESPSGDAYRLTAALAPKEKGNG